MFRKEVRRIFINDVINSVCFTRKNCLHKYTYIPSLIKQTELPTKIRKLIGHREIVGFGMNGQPMYCDNPLYPFPAIRWKEIDPEMQALKEREKGDWRRLTIADKKKLYRFSFRSTFAEFLAPSTEWMCYVGVALMFMSAGIWLFILLKLFVYEDYPDSFTYESKKAQVKRLLRMENNPITGLASAYDYDKNKWKKNITESRFTFPEGLDLSEAEMEAFDTK